MPKSYVFTEYGGPETQTFVDLPRPVPGPGQVMVAVHAAGVNAVDWKIRAGYLREVLPLPLPTTFGTEVDGMFAGVAHSQEWANQIGYGAPSPKDVHTTWGIRPTSFTEWARDHADLFDVTR